jgi:cell division septum initiation protein DivIVA
MSGANVDNVFDRVETKVKGLLDENAQLREQNRVLREAAKHIRDKRKCWEHDGVQAILSSIADDIDRLASEGA